MSSKASRIVARLLWVFPLILVLLAYHQTRVALDLRATWEAGEPATAEVLELEMSNRMDVVYDWVSLRVTMVDGTVFERERLGMPHSLAPRLEGKETLNVRVLQGAAQPIVIEEIINAQWRIAAVQALMAFFGALFLGFGVAWWNRYLRRQGDPALRPAPEQPVSAVEA